MKTETYTTAKNYVVKGVTQADELVGFMVYDRNGNRCDNRVFKTASKAMRIAHYLENCEQ